MKRSSLLLALLLGACTVGPDYRPRTAAELGVPAAFSVPGGASLDPEGREGVAALAAALLTEGAGNLTAPAFQDALRDAAISISFSADRDEFSGNFRCLTDALPEAAPDLMPVSGRVATD